MEKEDSFHLCRSLSLFTSADTFLYFLCDISLSLSSVFGNFWCILSQLRCFYITIVQFFLKHPALCIESTTVSLWLCIFVFWSNFVFWLLSFLLYTYVHRTFFLYHLHVKATWFFLFHVYFYRCHPLYFFLDQKATVFHICSPKPFYRLSFTI